MCHAKILMFLRKKNSTVKTVIIYTATATTARYNKNRLHTVSFENLKSSGRWQLPFIPLRYTLTAGWR
jgi:hypothetical protein